MLAGTHSAVGQTAALHGQVTDAESKEPLAQANIAIQGTDGGTTTDEDGQYELPRVLSGERTITVSYVGYRPQTLTVTLEPGADRQVNVELVPADLEVGTVTVRGQHTTQGLRTHRFRTADIERLPSAFDDNFFRSLSHLPGVTTRSDYSSRLHVRGGSASQTLVRLDGTTVYKPTHFFGFFSMFNPDAIGTVTLHKGPYPAEYGGRLGSVIDVQSRSGNRDRTGGGVTLSLTASRAYLNGPIGDQSAPTGSYLVAARRSTFDPVLSVLQNVDTEGIPNGLAFYDANVHLTVSPSPSDELSLVLYGARDALDLHLHEDGVQFDIRYENQGLNATWAHRFGPNLSASASLLGSRYHNTPVVDAWGTHFEEENGLAEGAFDAHFRYAGPDAHTLTGGLRTSGVRFQLHNSETREDRSLKVGWDRTASGVTTEAYVQDTYRPTRRWEIRGGGCAAPTTSGATSSGLRPVCPLRTAPRARSGSRRPTAERISSVPRTKIPACPASIRGWWPTRACHPLPAIRCQRERRSRPASTGRSKPRATTAS